MNELERNAVVIAAVVSAHLLFIIAIELAWIAGQV